MRITGPGGRVEAGGRLAAQLGRYEYAGDSTAWTVRAGCPMADEFWIEAAGLALVLRVGAQEWSWTGVTAEYAAGQITVTGNGKPYRQELTDGT